MIKAGIIGATGYAGNELVRLLMGHKEVEIKWYGSRSYIDQKYADHRRGAGVLPYVPLLRRHPEPMGPSALVPLWS